MERPLDPVRGLVLGLAGLGLFLGLWTALSFSGLVPRAFLPTPIEVALEGDAGAGVLVVAEPLGQEAARGEQVAGQQGHADAGQIDDVEAHRLRCEFGARLDDFGERFLDAWGAPLS